MSIPLKLIDISNENSSNLSPDIAFKQPISIPIYRAPSVSLSVKTPEIDDDEGAKQHMIFNNSLMENEVENMIEQMKNENIFSNNGNNNENNNNEENNAEKTLEIPPGPIEEQNEENLEQHQEQPQNQYMPELPRSKSPPPVTTRGINPKIVANSSPQLTPNSSRGGTPSGFANLNRMKSGTRVYPNSGPRLEDLTRPQNTRVEILKKLLHINFFSVFQLFTYIIFGCGLCACFSVGGVSVFGGFASLVGIVLLGLLGGLCTIGLGIGVFFFLVFFFFCICCLGIFALFLFLVIYTLIGLIPK